MPEMHPVDSSAVEAVGYDRDARELHVRFVGGALYVYSGVDEATFEELCGAESKGTYVNQVIKPRFPARRQG